MGELLIQIGIFAFLIGLGLFFGRSTERRHFRKLEEREAATCEFVITQLKSFPGFVEKDSPPQIVIAEAVIASDYLKSFLAGLRNLFGGQVGSYQTLLVRARREATLRVVEQASRLGYNAICNLRLQNADIGGGAAGGRRRAMVMATILASATAYHADVPSR